MLATLWHGGRLTEFYAALLDVKVRVEQHLRHQHRLDDDEVDDCVSTAYERLHACHINPMRRSSVTNPYNYFFTIAVRAAVDLHRRKKLHRSFDDTTVPDDSAEDPMDGFDQALSDHPVRVARVSADWATVVIEETVAEIEVADVGWAVEVTRLAISRLPPVLRRVAEHLAIQEFDDNDFAYNSQHAPDDLGMTPVAFRRAKGRAYERLRTLIPEAIDELGVVPPPRLAPTLFPERRPTIPSEEDTRPMSHPPSIGQDDPSPSK